MGFFLCSGRYIEETGNMIFSKNFGIVSILEVMGIDDYLQTFMLRNTPSLNSF